MKLSDGVEWSIHCTLFLSALPPGATLPGAALAEYHGVPESYLLKHLKALTAAGILDSVTGPSGGYRLARPPADISLLDIVEAVEGKEPAFRCTEIRQRGPCSLKSSAYLKPCGINRAMLRAEEAYRTALASEKLQAIADGFMVDVRPEVLAMTQDWIAENMRMPKS